MTKQKLINWINSFTTDIEFSYKGISGLIMPLSQWKGEENITLGYGDEDVVLKTAEEVVKYPMFNGRCLSEIIGEIEFNHEYADHDEDFYEYHTI